MVAGQTMLDNEGNEVVLFPMEYMYISQGEHQLYAIDFLGWNKRGRVYDCPVYAPFSGRVVFTGNDHNVILQSLDKVRFVDGTLDYATILVAHSQTDVPLMGQVFRQGTLFYHSGNYGHSFGDHLHLEVAKGHVTWDSSWLHLKNPYHMWDMMAVNNTVIKKDLGLDWKDYNDYVTPKTFKPHKFKWSIYERKLRNRNIGR